MKDTTILFEKMINVVRKSKFFDPYSSFNLKSEFLLDKIIFSMPFSLNFRNDCRSLGINNLVDLLNTNSDKFFDIDDFNPFSIIKNRKAIIDFLINKFKSGIEVHIDLEIEDNANRLVINKIPFFNIPIIECLDFSNGMIEHKLTKNIIDLKFNFSARFKHCLGQHEEIKTVKELLYTNIECFSNFENLGGISIREAQLLIYEYIINKDDPIIN